MSFYNTVLESVTRSHGARPFGDFMSRCHRVDKKDKHARWTNEDSIRHTAFQKSQINMSLVNRHSVLQVCEQVCICKIP
jgi:hypothetical protein